MTNEEIIADVAIGIFGEEAVNEMIENGEEIPLHTVKGWSERSEPGFQYRIKKGEHGVECRLWKKKKKKQSEDEQASDEQESLVPSNRDFYLAKAFLFSDKQVEKVSV